MNTEFKKKKKSMETRVCGKNHWIKLIYSILTD